MKPPNQQGSMLENQSLDFTQVVPGYAEIFRQGDWFKPEFAFACGRANMNMGRLVRYVGIKMKSVRTDSQNRRHISILPAYSG